MNIFLTSLMHPATANNFNQVLTIFELTVRSICAQTNRNFLIVIVCNKIPKINFHNEKIVYHVVSFPAASKNNLKCKRIDKASKLVSGLCFLKKYNPNFVYITDADDWLSRDVNEYLEQNSSNFGFCSNTGYLIDIRQKQYVKKYGLHRFSGSSFAIKYNVLMEAFKLLEKLNQNSDLDTICDSVPEDILLNVINSHRYIEFFKTQGKTFEAFPFASLGWIRNTGNNNIGESDSIKGLYLNSKLLSNFGLDSDFCLDENTKSPLLNYVQFIKSALLSYLGSLMNLRYKLP